MDERKIASEGLDRKLDLRTVEMGGWRLRVGTTSSPLAGVTLVACVEPSTVPDATDTGKIVSMTLVNEVTGQTRDITDRLRAFEEAREAALAEALRIIAHSRDPDRTFRFDTFLVWSTAQSFPEYPTTPRSRRDLSAILKATQALKAALQAAHPVNRAVVTHGLDGPIEPVLSALDCHARLALDELPPPRPGSPSRIVLGSPIYPPGYIAAVAAVLRMRERVGGARPKPTPCAAYAALLHRCATSADDPDVRKHVRKVLRRLKADGAISFDD